MSKSSKCSERFHPLKPYLFLLKKAWALTAFSTKQEIASAGDKVVSALIPPNKGALVKSVHERCQLCIEQYVAEGLYCRYDRLYAGSL